MAGGGGGAGGGGQQGNEGGSSILWIIAAVFVFGGVLWYAFKKQIIGYYFDIKLAEINFLSLFTNHLESLRSYILTANFEQLNFQDVVNVGQAVGNYIRYPLVLILMVMAVLVFTNNKTRVYKKIYSMLDLANDEKTNWPQISPVLKLNLIKTDIDKGPWAMALTPMQFCKRFHLLQEVRRAPQEGVSQKEWGKVEATLKRGEANKVFAIQLGPLWPGQNRLPPHVKSLFAIFAARVAGDTSGAYDVVQKINRTAEEKLDFSCAEELFHKHVNHKIVQKIINSHAYLLTVMAEMLRAARSDGVQASADFLWLKPVDRRMWYMLNTVGRQTPFVEVAGPYAHWLAENLIGRRLLVPMVEEATNALEGALKEIVYRPDEKE